MKTDKRIGATWKRRLRAAALAIAFGVASVAGGLVASGGDSHDEAKKVKVVVVDDGGSGGKGTAPGGVSTYGATWS